jgi:hypothetical protein
MYVHIDNHMNWKDHVEQILPKLISACFSIRNLIHTLNLDILHMVYVAYFHSMLQYGIIFWWNSTHVHQVFKLQKRVVRLMFGAGPRSSCRQLFRKLNILRIACQYMLSLVLFIADNQKDFLSNAFVHGLDTRNKNHFCGPVVSLSYIQKGVSYSGVKIFNSLPSNIRSHRNDRKRFKHKLYRYLIIHSFFWIIEFLECKIDKDDI